MKILFDNGTPKPIARSLTGYEVNYARQIGWHEPGNGELIRQAKKAGYDVLLSTDKNSISAEPIRPKNRPGHSRQPTMAVCEAESR